jgi:hypothetical protein
VGRLRAQHAFVQVSLDGADSKVTFSANSRFDPEQTKLTNVKELHIFDYLLTAS